MQLTKKQYHFLVNHMMDLHRRKLDIVKAYTMDYDAYTKMLDFLNSYIKQINDLLDNAQTTEVLDSLPFVILGSRVEVEGAVTGERESLCILLPQDMEKRAASYKAVKAFTCPTPQSDMLLFKKVGDSVTLKENGISRRMNIKSIECILAS